ncbi:MAG TPA: pyridoxamine 5'-phosphate oxidase family protein [Streptosporangiaceae bacterium]|nr:pyridoxamine 5'-phosphate oxidase family protein [Streptosporangiaceae bacterium]
MALLDVTRSDDRHTAERLTAEPIVWLGTVRPDGRPHTVPVWFAWHDPLVLIFSMPRTVKVRNARLSPAVSLALDSADGGRDVVLAEGRVTVLSGADQHPHFLAAKFRDKYAQSLGSRSFEEWRATFSQPLLVHVQRITAWTRTADGVAYRVVP